MYTYIYVYIQRFTYILIFTAIAELQAGINAKRAEMERERCEIYRRRVRYI